MYFVCMLLLFPVSFVLPYSRPLMSGQQQTGVIASTVTGTQQSQPEAPNKQSKTEANARIQRSIEDLLRGDPQLSGADLHVNVDDHDITLTGTVDSYTQHQRVLALLQQYSRYRQIVDKLQAK